VTWAVHAIASIGGAKMTTLCGMVAFRTNVSTEWESAGGGGKYTGGIIETAPQTDNRTVTCKRCLKAIELARTRGDKLGMVKT
jgi:hypothetical protein